MPSEQSTWLIAVPQDGDTEGVAQDLTAKIQQQSRNFPAKNIAEFAIPSFKVRLRSALQIDTLLMLHIWKTGTLDLLVTLSEELPKHDTYFTSVVAKIVDTLRNLLNNEPQKLRQHILIEERPIESYLLENWRWNEGRYNVQRSVKELVDTLSKVCGHDLNLSTLH